MGIHLIVYVIRTSNIFFLTNTYLKTFIIISIWPQEINKKVDSKIQRVEENILQWIDEETKVLKDNLEKDIQSIRTEVDTKNVELNSKVQTSIHDLRDL